MQLTSHTNDFVNAKSHARENKPVLAGYALRSVAHYYFAGLSLRAGGCGFPPATMSMSPGYFHGKQKEN